MNLTALQERQEIARLETDLIDKTPIGLELYTEYGKLGSAPKRNDPQLQSVIPCHACGRRYVYQGSVGEDRLNGRFCSDNCRAAYDTGFPSFPEQEADRKKQETALKNYETKTAEERKKEFPCWKVIAAPPGVDAESSYYQPVVDAIDRCEARQKDIVLDPCWWCGHSISEEGSEDTKFCRPKCKDWYFQANGNYKPNDEVERRRAKKEEQLKSSEGARARAEFSKARTSQKGVLHVANELQQIAQALDVSHKLIKYDERLSKYSISGSRGYLYIDDGQWYVCVSGRSKRHLTGIKQKLSFMELVTEIDAEGLFRLPLETLPTNEQSIILRKAVGLKKKPNLTPERRNRLKTAFAVVRAKNGHTDGKISQITA